MNTYKDYIGQAFFALSIIMLIYMIVSPMTNVIASLNEYFTLTLINFPVSDIIHIAGGDVNPPLYYLLLKAASKLTTDLSFLKLFSIIPYAIIILVSTFKIRSDYDWFCAGLFALSIAVMSEFLTGFLLLRPYSWTLLFTVLAFVYMRDLVSDKINIKSAILFTLFCVLASYCHYYGVITSVCLYIIFAVHRIKFSTDEYRYFTFSLAAALILYIPWIMTLLNVLLKMNGFAMPDIIQTLSYFAYSGDTLFSAVTLMIFIIIAAVYFKSTEEDNFYVLAGIATYFATILLALIISLFKPVLVQNALLPASGILLLTIAIMISKLKKRKFAIAVAFMALLLVAGFATSMVDSHSIYQEGLSRQTAFDNITQDNDSIVIVSSPGAIMYFLDYSKDVDMYCLELDYVYGENMNRTHEIFDFKDIAEEDIQSFAQNNTDKNIYLIGWQAPDVNLTTTEILKEDTLIISKVDNANMTDDDEEYYY